MSIDALIDSFVTRFTDQAIGKLPAWLRPIARQIVAAFKAVDLDAELKRLVDEWLNGDQSEPLVVYAMKRVPEGRVAFAAPSAGGLQVGIDPFTILTLIQLAIKLFGLLRQPAVSATADGSADETDSTVAAFEEALAS